jgi:hypothetical protein
LVLQSTSSPDFIECNQNICIVEYSAGKVIETNVSGVPTSTIKINVRDGVIQTVFPYSLGIVMSGGSTLAERFVAQELDDSVRPILKDAFDERMCSKNPLLREFQFNCFDVSLDVEKRQVTLQDDVCCSL